MTDQELMLCLLGKVKPEVYRAFESRLEGTSPAGPPSESGCGDAQRRNDQRPTDIPHGSAVVEAKGRVELERLLKHAVEQVAWWRYVDEKYRLKGQKIRSERAHAAATVHGQYAAKFEAALAAEPRPQSAEEEVEEEGVCHHLWDWPCDRMRMVRGDYCHACPLRGKRMERSGLHNAGSETRPHDINPT